MTLSCWFSCYLWLFISITRLFSAKLKIEDVGSLWYKNVISVFHVYLHSSPPLVSQLPSWNTFNWYLMRGREEALNFLRPFWDQGFESCSHCSNKILFPLLFTSVQVVEELLSLSGGLQKDTAKSIADAAMLEVASISMGHMVCKL